MADASPPQPASETPRVGLTPKTTPKTIIQEYLLERLPVYRELRELQRQASRPFPCLWFYTGWESKDGDTHFQQQRQRADYADAKTKLSFFNLMRDIGLELDKATSALTIDHDADTRPAILDLCMAPGGFAAAALHRNPSALLRGISLPRTLGGHEMLLRNWSHTDPNADIYVTFRDITLLAAEMGTPLSRIPASHPDAGSFSAYRPFLDQKFDLVFCDGQVLRTHERAECTFPPSGHLRPCLPPLIPPPLLISPSNPLTQPQLILQQNHRPPPNRTNPPPNIPTHPRPHPPPPRRHPRHTPPQSGCLGLSAPDSYSGWSG
ncbi:uncharacterized protein B0H64DRAFT_321444 [Chaetomium fimeti]|uniref:Ribosomal RNA methyltransferase FtsJ domain-containing protein n=1 Tax=Chaetomium fimeti TaxID=1854472 RepID=A0AAE0HF63_9PEZI|nr:hypothetical protein B0H64DRAFT_321444 [Chaetomium fimeti]